MTGHPRELLGRIRAKARIGIVVEAAGVLLLLGLAYLVVSYGLDRTLRLEVGYRLGIFAVLAVAVVRHAWKRLVRPLGVELGDDELALAVERHDPASKESLITALQFERALAGPRAPAESTEMMGKVVQDVHGRIGSYTFAAALDGQRVLRYLGGAVVAVLAMGTWTALDPHGIAIWARRCLLFGDVDWPRRTHLEFADGTAALRLPEGDDLTVRVRARGVIPEQVALRYRFANGERGEEPMSVTGDGEFSVTLQALLHDVVVWAEGGDGETGEVRVTLVARPRIGDLQAQIVFPEYMKKATEAVPQTEGDLRLPRGSKLALRATSSKPLQQAFAVHGADRKVELALAAGHKSFAGVVEPTETGLIVLDVLDEDRLGAAKAPRLFVRLVDDQTPRIDYKPLGVSHMLTPWARVPGRVIARDDYGLTGLEAAIRVADERKGDEAPASQPESAFSPLSPDGIEAFVAGETEFNQVLIFDLRRLNPDADFKSERNRMHPDQTLSIRFTARDNFGPGAPHEGQSEAVTFRIVTREKLLEELQRRQIEQRRELVQILQQQKADLSELKILLSPAGADPRAAQARVRLQTMARGERALGKRTQSVAERYQLILDEMANNRLFDDGRIKELELQIVQPLTKLFTDDFPTAAELVAEFGTGGKEDVRSSAVAAYESIIRRIEQVLKHMDELENMAAVIQALREQLKLHDETADRVKQHRRNVGESIFGPTETRPSDGTRRDADKEKK